MNKQEIQQEALARARNPIGSNTNYHSIIHGFTAKGIPADDITPRVNVFTFHAWQALGRVVRKGEHGVKVLTFVPMDKSETGADGKEKVSHYSRPRSTTVFHVSQTEPINGQTEAQVKPQTRPEPIPEPVQQNNGNNYSDGFKPIARKSA